MFFYLNGETEIRTKLRKPSAVKNTTQNEEIIIYAPYTDAWVITAFIAIILTIATVTYVGVTLINLF